MAGPEAHKKTAAERGKEGVSIAWRAARASSVPALFVVMPVKNGRGLSPVYPVRTRAAALPRPLPQAGGEKVEEEEEARESPSPPAGERAGVRGRRDSRVTRKPKLPGIGPRRSPRGIQTP